MHHFFLPLMLCVATLVVQSKLSVAHAEDTTDKAPLTAEEVLEKKLTGKATVEIVVEEVHTLNIDSVFKAGVSHAQILKAKVVGGKADEEFLIIVSRDVATQLLKAGVGDPAKYFRGKIVRVTGTLERTDNKPPEKSVSKLRVTSMEQIEKVRVPKEHDGDR